MLSEGWTALKSGQDLNEEGVLSPLATANHLLGIDIVCLQRLGQSDRALPRKTFSTPRRDPRPNAGGANRGCPLVRGNLS